ncbi:exo-beta-1,3-glucanase (GH17 family) [Lutibacter sp. Hel_I_33_5]|uniref:glycoside hydrolase family 17 protein n=1 Tax=Lutibacter sp. Hel_I_33_5 TaxID=1566289 RepID=UPI0011A569B2|nr:glycosyl hydrolase family 17 protein [Lutibacter sp. Hel_I_33_5]TVZ57227.1 exo-beta-1,3-glucanase (GH17 family) [Lutibacter sp. Hel_I_33_5]
MSYRSEKFLPLAQIDFEENTTEILKQKASAILKKGMHGICFSPYLEHQKPGDTISKEQIRERLEVIQPYTNWIRTFSCTDGNEHIPIIAKELGLKTLVGAWLGVDKTINETEISNLISLSKSNYVDIAAVGNEVMYRGDLTEEELLKHIQDVKSQIPNIPVGYVDSYYEFSDRPKLTETCDVILANCYPFWEGCDQDYSLLYMKDMYQRALKAAKGKKVIITETGWPFKGTKLHGAHPSEDNALKYFINSQNWSQEDAIDIFYFSSFDETWKESSEGDVGPYWGIWDKLGDVKF